ncbi:hypothetical protein [Streptomyces sp. Caat 7-52]|nr:hypothetical protein [Streptomyces sp. Caat 7-52]
MPDAVARRDRTGGRTDGEGQLGVRAARLDAPAAGPPVKRWLRGRL